MLVDDPGREGLFGDLAIVDLLFHGSLGEESVDVDGLFLTKSVDPEDGLDVVSRVPGGVEDDDAIGGHQIDSKTSGFRRDEEESGLGVARLQKSF